MESGKCLSDFFLMITQQRLEHQNIICHKMKAEIRSTSTRDCKVYSRIFVSIPRSVVLTVKSILTLFTRIVNPLIQL